jgi:3-hydroxyisobutyrate dehydrogenase-like beta-hydroxyacid dehydrogenase
MKIAFIGLGVMGAPMAGHLADKTAAAVTVYNRTAAKAEAWLARHKGAAAATPAEAAQDADFIFSCVGNDDDLRGVLRGIGAKPGAVIVDHTTTSAEVAREMAEMLAAQGCAFIDAPVSGGEAGAVNGTLTVMAGGDAQAFARVEPLLRASYAKEARLLGPAGAGQLAKMVNQLCIAGVLQGLSEALALGMKTGLPMEDVLDVIGKGAAQSWQMDNRGKTMLRGEFDFGFAVDWMIKDLGIALAEAGRNGLSLPLAQHVLEQYEALSAAGGGRLDTSALIRRAS